MNKFRKISSIILSVLMIFTLIGVKEETVYADEPHGGSGSIEAKGLFEQIFDLDGLMWNSFDRGHEIDLYDEYGGHAAYCIEPEDPIPESETYYNAHHNGYADYSGARDVLLHWNKLAKGKYAGYVWGTGAYYAVQLAVWGRLKGMRPGDTLRSRILPGSEDIANQILDIADELYDMPHLANAPEIVYNNYSTGVDVANDMNLQELPTAYKTKDGHLYWRSPLIVVKSGGNNMYDQMTHLEFDVSKSNLVTDSQITMDDILITDAGNFDKTHFEHNVGNGNAFYIWVPMFKDSTPINAPGSFNVNIKVKYKYADTVVYDPANPEYQSIMTIVESEGEDNKTLTMRWNGFDVPTSTTGTIITKKVGRYYNQRTTQNFTASNGQSYEYFNLTLADDVGIPGVRFYLKKEDGTAENHTRYTSFLDGTVKIEYINLSDTDATRFILMEDASSYLIANPITGTDGNPETATDSAGIVYPVVKHYTFTPAEGDAWKTKDFSEDPSKWIHNDTKTLTITAVKKDRESGETVQGAVFAVYNTQPIVVADPASSTGFAAIQPGSRIAVGETDASGSVNLGEFVDDQTYIVEEISAPSGYELNSEVLSKKKSTTVGDINEANRQNTQSGNFDRSQSGNVTNYTFTFNNDVEVAEYSLKKVDGETGEALPGAGFQIYTEDGTTALDYVVTGEDGIAKFVLPTGKYLVKETAVPEGYEMDQELVDGVVITVSADSDVVNMTVIKNNKIKFDPITVTQTITKVVTGDTPDAPTNFRFKIGNPDGEFERNIYGAGEVLVTHTFDKAGLYSFTISEVNGGINGYTYDDSSYDVIFEVTADYENKVLVAGEPQIFKDGNPWTEGIVFTNNYKKPEKIDEPVKVDLTFYKKISGNPKEKETFTFDITEQKEGGQTTSQAIKGSGSITITLEGDEVGSEIYTISERNLTSTQIAKGWKKDNSIYTVTFTVSDIDGDGVYEGKVDVKKDGEKVDRIEFTNTYSTSLTCRSGYHLEDEKCVKDSDGCEEGYHYDKDKKACVKDETSCKEGYTLKDGVCVEEKTDNKTSPKTGIDFNYMHSYYKGRN